MLLLQVLPYKMRQRQTPLNSHLHKSIHVVNYSLCLIFFYSSYFCSRDLKDWIKSPSVVFCRNSLTDAHIPKPWAYYRIMFHVYPHLLPYKLETWALGLFYYHRLILGFQDAISIVVYLACVRGWLTDTGRQVFDAVKQILRAECWQHWIYSQPCTRAVAFCLTTLLIYVALTFNIQYMIFLNIYWTLTRL